jgi:hypothetical protein
MPTRGSSFAAMLVCIAPMKAAALSGPMVNEKDVTLPSAGRSTSFSVYSTTMPAILAGH